MTTTGKVVLAAGASLLLYEAYVLSTEEKDDTISEFIWSTLRRPLVAFGLGAITSHFVWQSQDVYDRYAEKALEDRRKGLRRKADVDCIT